MRTAILLASTALLAVAANLACPGGDDPAGAGRPDVVLLVLDEFPGDSLLDERGRIDPVRYPNFAALASDATWFRNAFSVYDSTTKAVPLILDGRRPVPGSSGDRRSHPRSIFDALAGRGYRTVSAEEATAVCPPGLCRGAPTRRPAIIPRLNAGRVQRFDRFVRSIRPGPRPTFWMKHALLPHGPYLFLPSGAQARHGVRDLVPGMNGVPGFHDAFLTRHNEQRYLLQLQFVDRLVGRLIRRLKTQGMYDRTLIVVTADHGIAFQVGVKTRRSVSASNVEELTPVPLIVKAPGQRTGRVSHGAGPDPRRGAHDRRLECPAVDDHILGSGRRHAHLVRPRDRLDVGQGLFEGDVACDRTGQGEVRSGVRHVDVHRPRGLVPRARPGPGSFPREECRCCRSAPAP